MKVLVLDDDRAFADMVRSALLEDGHEVISAADGRAGLEVLGRWVPDVILLDLHMPRMDGPSFARRYARLPGPHAPIIVVTGTQDSYSRPIKDVAAHLRKPFELDLLRGLLRQISETHGRRRPLQ